MRSWASSIDKIEIVLLPTNYQQKISQEHAALAQTKTGAASAAADMQLLLRSKLLVRLVQMHATKLIQYIKHIDQLKHLITTMEQSYAISY